MGKLGLKLWFWNTFHHILMHFVHQFQCFEMFLIVFSKTVFFLKFVSLCQFRLIQSVFRSIEIVLNCLRKPLSVSIDPICFSINRNCFEIVLKNFKEPLSVSINRNSWIRFLKNHIWLVQTNFSKLFPLSPNRQGFTKIFLSFSSKFLARFLSP